MDSEEGDALRSLTIGGEECSGAHSVAMDAGDGDPGQLATVDDPAGDATRSTTVDVEEGNTAQPITVDDEGSDDVQVVTMSAGKAEESDAAQLVTMTEPVTTESEECSTGQPGTMDSKESEVGGPVTVVQPGTVDVNASFNVLERFASFVPVARALKHLDVSHNVISRCDNLATLTELAIPLLNRLTNLTYLDISNNRLNDLPNLSKLPLLRTVNLHANQISSLSEIHRTMPQYLENIDIGENLITDLREAIPLLDRLTNLTYLDISNNRLSDLPNLSKLPLLRTVNLHANQISSLSEIHRTMPQYLENIDVGENLITDLREAHFLSHLRSIRSITFAGNPCVRLEGRTFCYRPYLYYCCLETLQSVDEKELGEIEIIKGEELHNNAKVRHMETHAQLCAYLKKVCPQDYQNTFSMEDSHLLKRRRVAADISQFKYILFNSHLIGTINYLQKANASEAI
ncbi:unnamed protein product [Gongylonema pulchrum]|uniref:Protein phosphatase 1 regulatory subunit 22 n=1 Tax=Gongylonema pulchrum TaxID=637853 RepID=A0A183DT17_9BILA|nr:unnamed protein product [Gongylonema pulchrum]